MLETRAETKTGSKMSQDLQKDLGQIVSNSLVVHGINKTMLINRDKDMSCLTEFRQTTRKNVNISFLGG